MTWSSVRIAAAALAFAFALPLSATAFAQSGDVDERARIHFQSGREHYANGDYEAALREFEAAYELSQRAGLLYNLYLTQERLNLLEQALESLDGFLASDAVPDADRPTLEARRENLADRIARQEPAEPDVIPPPDGPPPETAPADEDRGGGIGLPAILAFSAGGVGLVMFAAFGGATLAENGRLADDCGSNAGRTCQDDDLGTLRTFAALADVGWILAAAGATAGILLWLLDPGGEPESDTARVGGFIHDGGAGAVVQGSF